jgi:alpha-glucoside transport system substrate-binding protein
MTDELDPIERELAETFAPERPADAEWDSVLSRVVVLTGPSVLDRLRARISALRSTRVSGHRTQLELGRRSHPPSNSLRSRLMVGTFVAAILAGGIPALLSWRHSDAVSVALPAAAAGSGNSTTAWATWNGAEQSAFNEVLDGFHQQSGYQPKGDALPGSLLDAIARGTAPDIAVLPQSGLLQELAHQHILKPLDHVLGADMSRDLAPAWRGFATVDHQIYGVYFKAANKSTIWYNVRLFQRAGITQSPATYDQLLGDMATLKARGITPFAMCGATGWTLTDWFENVYLRTAGQNSYNQLAHHLIPWTDPSVTSAFRALGRIFDDPSNMVGGFEGAASTAYPDCVGQVFGSNPRAAMLFEGDFVETSILALPDPQSHDVFPFPSINDSPPAVSAGGDVAVMLHDTPQSEALIRYLASPAAGAVWAKRGGFVSPNPNVDLALYPDDEDKINAKALLDASATGHLVFDMSDQAPPEFGSTVDAGEWADLQNWLRNHQDPNIVASTQTALERDASRSHWP